MIRPLCFAAALLALTATSAAAQDREIHHEHPGEAALGYAQAVRVGTTLYVSGTVSRGETMEEQVTGAYRRIRATLRRFGVGPEAIVKETVYTTDIDALNLANSARLAFYAGHTPAATWVQIERLLMPQAMVEIEVIVDLTGAAPPGN